MTHALGRAYSSAVQSSIDELGRDLDVLMTSTPALVAGAGVDLSSQVRDLNARLVNDVILASDVLTDEQAIERLFGIRSEVLGLQGIFQQHGVPLQGRIAVPTTQDVAVLPVVDAQAFLDQLKQAFDLYPNVIDRYTAIRPAFSATQAVPLLGPIAGSAVTAVDRTVGVLDEDVYFIRDGIMRLEQEIADPPSDGAVRIARPTFVKLQNWIAGVFQVDTFITRFEGSLQGKPAETSAAGTWPYLLVGGGLAALGLILLLSD